MPSFLPETLRSWTSGDWHREPSARVDGFAIDSRKVERGQMFVALKTGKRDGHDFLEMAKERGASAALVSTVRPEVDLPQLCVENTLGAFQTIARRHRAHFEGPVIGVTGTCGKTSTKEILSLLLGDYGVHRTLGNLNNHLGVPLTLLQLDPAEHRYAVIEAGINQPGEMETLAEMIQPDIAVITGIGPAHLEGMGDLETIAREKAMLAGNLSGDGWAIFPEDCLQYRPFRNLGNRAVVLGESEREAGVSKAVFKACLHPKGGVDLHYTLPAGEERRFVGPAMSPGMRRNAGLALVVADRLGISPTFLQFRLPRWRPASFRGEILALGRNHYYVDCYNANPASMADTFASFTETFADQPRCYVLGCMRELGPESAKYHRLVGMQLKLNAADRALVIGEDAEAFRAGMLDVGAQPEQVEVVDDLERPREVLAEWGEQKGAVLLKGSRAYRLELLLPETADSAGKEAAAC